MGFFGTQVEMRGRDLQILSVPQLRKIYDEGGVEGLAMPSWLGLWGSLWRFQKSLGHNH